MVLKFIILLLFLLTWLVISYLVISWSIVVTSITSLIFLTVSSVSLIWIWTYGHFSKCVKYLMTLAQGLNVAWQFLQLVFFFLFIYDTSGNSSADYSGAIYAFGTQLFSWTAFALNIETLISFAVVNERLNKVVLNRIRVIVIIIWIALVVPNFVLIGQILTGAPQLTGFLASISYWVSVLGPGLFLVCDNAQSVYLIYALKKLKNIKQGFRDIVLILVIQIILDWVSFICAFLGLHLPKGTLLHVTNQVYVAASGGFHTFLSITAFYHLRVIALTKSKILTAKRAPVGRSEHRPSHISFQVSNHPKSPSPTRFTIDTVK